MSGSGTGMYHARPSLTEEEWTEVAARLRVPKRELAVLQLLFRGLSEKQIATEMALSPLTVHTYLRRLHIRLDVRTRTELLLVLFDQFMAHRDSAST